MASREKIIEVATELGKLIAETDAAKKYDAVVKKFNGDHEAQRALNDFNRYAQEIGQKEAAGGPIEVDEKKKLEELQQAVMANPVLGELQMAQMDYLDLMRAVDQAMTGEAGAAADATPSPTEGGAGKIITG